MKRNLLHLLIIAVLIIQGTCAYADESTGILVDPAETTATITWNVDSDAQSYQLDIYHDGAVFAHITLGANGQLQGISFNAPSRERKAKEEANTLSFMVTGLTAATRYNYVMSYLNASGTPLHVYIGDFATTGYPGDLRGDYEVIPTPPIIPSNPEAQAPTGIEQTDEEQCPNGVVLMNGQLFIRRDGKTYSVTGQIVQ